MSKFSQVVATQNNRVTFIDAARGLFIFWMLAAHTLTLADVPADHFLQVLRPAGWSTLNFIMLTGFSLAIFYSTSSSLKQGTQGKLLRRALQVGVIALVSNFFFVILRYIAGGNLDASALFQILSLQTPWTISAVLLPTAIVLCASPFLLRTLFRIGPLPFFSLATVLVLLLECTVQYHVSSFRDVSWFSACFETDNAYFGGFPVIKMATFAIWSFGLGSLIRIVPVTKVTTVLGALSLFLIALPWHLPFFVVSAARFGLSVGGVALADGLKSIRGLLYPFRLLGRSSLLIFFLHRVLAQIGRPLLGVKLESGALGAILMLVTLGFCILACYVRESNLRIDTQLKRIGL